MKKYFVSSIMMLVCLTLIVIPPAKAQGSSVGLSIRVSPTTTAPGTTVGVIGYVTNMTTKKMRATVTFTSLSPCGIETQIGYNRVALNPGQTMMITATYPIASDACLGPYTVSISASGATTSTTLLVQ
ncbi:MAG TPA: hypothetical protein VF075_00335 [Pyrinomonadaceae bacterium]